MAKAKVYLETTIPSYLAAPGSDDVIIAGRQMATHKWWSRRRNDFDLFVSQADLIEASRGDQGQARKRVEFLTAATELDISDGARGLAADMIRSLSFPERAGIDALHVAIATVHGIDYLMTWNFKHLANATRRFQIESFIRLRNYIPPLICTPEELLED